MSQTDVITDKVLRKIKPSEKEAKSIGDFCTHIEKIVKEELGHDSVVVGSIGKKTWLSGDHDIDLFVFFDKTTSRDQLEKDGLELGRQLAAKLKSKYIIKYAEHPYTQISSRGFKIDVVPCYKIDIGDKIISAVDRSPLHLRLILDKLKPEFRDDVRLLKQFMKGVGVYGSDVKNQGFSGYICELLVLEYGKFSNAIASIAKWDAPVRIEIGEKKTEKKFGSPLTMIDPTDSNRNAAAAISAENFQRLVCNSEMFMKKPSIKFFFSNPEALSASDILKIRKRGTKFIALAMKRPDGIDDTVWPQLRRAASRIKGVLEHEEFVVKRYYEFADGANAVLMFELTVWSLPAIKKMVGPPIYAKKHAHEFLIKYKDVPFGPAVEGDLWTAEKNREFLKANGLLMTFIKKNRAYLKEAGIPDLVNGVIGKSKLLEDTTFWGLVHKNKALSEYLKRKYFEKFV